MATAVYFMSLGLASGLVGLWCRRMLASLGLIHGFEAALWVAAFVAVAYLATQTAFRAAVMLIKPVRAYSFTVTEILSESTALLLLPSLAGLSLPLPYATLQKMEPFFHFGIFAALHCFFKLMAFFAAVQGQPASRLRFLPWLTICGLCGIVGYGIVDQYLEEIDAKQPMVVGIKEPFTANNTYADACKAPEHVRVLLSFEKQRGDRISFLWAARDAGESFPETVYVTYDAYDTVIDPETVPLPSPVFSKTHALHVETKDWMENTFDREALPDGVLTLAVSWSSGEPDNVMQRFGLSPPVDSGLAMMVSGPWQHSMTKDVGRPSIVVVVVEALGAENMNSYGYHRNTVPFLTERLPGMVLYEEAYTPTPQTAGACMSLFTGVNPFVHRYYDTFNGPLPERINTLPEILRDAGYLTVAFTEGRGADGNDLHYGSGFERGFVAFNDVFPMDIRTSRRADATTPVQPTPAGAWATLQKAGNWIEEHLNDQYMIFIRLRDLRNPTPLPYYGNGFIGQGRKPDPVDIYDTAVTYVDKQLSAFVDRLHEIPAENRPVLVITSSHGFDFTEPGRGAWRRGGPPRRTLHESALRIPLMLDIPNRYGSTQRTLVSLEDVAVTIAGLANTSFSHPVEGTDILNQSNMRERISMAGNPVVLSLRTGHWRFTWHSGLAPFTLSPINTAQVQEFLDISRYRTNLAPVDNMRREPRLAQSFTQKMQFFLSTYKEKDGAL